MLKHEKQLLKERSAQHTFLHFDMSTPGKYYDTKNLQNAKPPKFNIPNQPNAQNQGMMQ